MGSRMPDEQQERSDDQRRRRRWRGPDVADGSGQHRSVHRRQCFGLEDIAEGDGPRKDYGGAVGSRWPRRSEADDTGHDDEADLEEGAQARESTRGVDSGKYLVGELTKPRGLCLIPSARQRRGDGERVRRGQRARLGRLPL